MQRKPRHLTTGVRNGRVAYCWQPSASLGRLGFELRRLSDDPAIAWREAEELNAEADRYRELVGADPLGRPRTGTVRWLAAQFKAHDDHLTLAERTREDYARFLDMICGLIGDERVDDITPPVVAEIKRLGKDRPWQTNYMLRVLRLLFSFGVREGYCTTNPARAFRQLRTRPREAVWTHEQESRFLAACEEMGRPSVALAYRIAVWTAQRQADVLRLSWTDYRDGALHVRQGKTGRSVVIPFVGPLAEALEAAPRVATVIVADERGRAWKAYHFRHVFKRIMRAAGVEGVRFQDLRRTAIVRLAEAGCTMPEIAAISGHQIDYCQRILEVYLPRTRRLAERAVVKLVRNETGTQGRRGV